MLTVRIRNPVICKKHFNLVRLYNCILKTDAVFYNTTSPFGSIVWASKYVWISLTERPSYDKEAIYTSPKSYHGIERAFPRRMPSLLSVMTRTLNASAGVHCWGCPALPGTMAYTNEREAIARLRLNSRPPDAPWQHRSKKGSIPSRLDKPLSCTCQYCVKVQRPFHQAKPFVWKCAPRSSKLWVVELFYLRAFNFISLSWSFTGISSFHTRTCYIVEEYNIRLS